MSLFCLLFRLISPPSFSFFFFFNDTATTEIYTLSLHDALPISRFRLAPPRSSRSRVLELSPRVPWDDQQYISSTKFCPTGEGKLGSGAGPPWSRRGPGKAAGGGEATWTLKRTCGADRKSTRLNSSHSQ